MENCRGLECKIAGKKSIRISSKENLINFHESAINFYYHYDDNREEHCSFTTGGLTYNEKETDFIIPIPKEYIKVNFRICEQKAIPVLNLDLLLVEAF